FDAELGRPEAFPTDQAAVVVAEGIQSRAGLAQPEGWFDQGHHARVCHCLVVVGGSGGHVYMRIEELHAADMPQVGGIRIFWGQVCFGDVMTATHNLLFFLPVYSTIFFRSGY